MLGASHQHLHVTLQTRLCRQQRTRPLARVRPQLETRAHPSPRCGAMRAQQQLRQRSASLAAPQPHTPRRHPRWLLTTAAAAPPAGSQQQQQQQQPQQVTVIVPAQLQQTPAPQAGAAASAQDAHPEAWAACVQHVTSLGFTEAEAGQFVQRAFGWGPRARAYWRHEKSEAAPDLQQMQAVLAFLSSELGMDAAGVAKTVKAFPEVLGCAVDSQLARNVQKLQSEWRLQGDVLLKAVLRNPPLLGYNVDCMGDCVGECNRCWARF